MKQPPLAAFFFNRTEVVLKLSDVSERTEVVLKLSDVSDRAELRIWKGKPPPLAAAFFLIGLRLCCS